MSLVSTPLRASNAPSLLWARSRWLEGALWIAASLTGMYVAMGYDFRPGRLGPRQANWPLQTHLTRSPGRETLVAFLHPRCVCSRATVHQLVNTVRAHPDAELLGVVFVPPGQADPAAWEEGEYVKTLRAEVPRVRIVYDRGGVEAEHFGAYTSGTVLLYDPDGRELFRGGITSKRGGDEDNPSVRRLAQTIADERPVEPGRTSPVFGCPLVASARRLKDHGAAQ